MELKNEKIEELKDLSRRLSVKGAGTSTHGPEIIVRYENLAKEVKQSPALADAIFERAYSLINQGRLCEAILTFEKRLLESPMDFSAQISRNHILNLVHEEMARLADLDPECAEFGRTYERLLELGHVGFRLHVGAVQYYLGSGNILKAEERLLAIAQVTPNAPGVAGLIHRVAEVSDNTRIQKLKIALQEVK